MEKKDDHRIEVYLKIQALINDMPVIDVLVILSAICLEVCELHEDPKKACELFCYGLRKCAEAEQA